jgi:hypothetical protein
MTDDYRRINPFVMAQADNLLTVARAVLAELEGGKVQPFTHRRLRAVVRACDEKKPAGSEQQ